ncbi:MAG: cell division protein FtsL [Lachnospiraceae bacterium]|nr:cell division protein FtsL [Lachnospiraceae bacterium]
MAYSSTYRNVPNRNHNNRVQRTYVDGNTVRKLNVVEEIQKPVERKPINHAVRKNREKALYMNLGYVLFLVAALVAAAMILIGYIQVQSDIILSVKNIAAMESELNDLRLTNDENYARAASSVDLEEIRRVAIGELGMRYAKEGQIINVSGEGIAYVRQLAEIQE